MSSFFRSANDVTSSDGEDDSDSKSSNEGKEREQPDVLGRITTISSDNDDVGEIPRPEYEVDAISQYHERVTQLPYGDAAGHQSFLLHALLEERCANQALEHLNSRSQENRCYTREDIAVQQKARQLYDDLCRHLVPRGLLPQGPEQEQYRGQRQGYRQGLSLLSRNLSQDGNESALSREGNNKALPPASRPRLQGSAPPASVGEALPAAHADGARTFGHPSLQNTDAVPSLFDTITSHRILDLSRYGNDFTETARVGSGGYGEVFAVKHNISGVDYAIKKIPIGGSRLRRIRERGQPELDALLNELRILARLDHPNIVRYYNGWLEPSAEPGTPLGYRQSAAAPQQLLLLDRDDDIEFSSSGDRKLHIESRKGSIDIVFEHSDTGVEPIVHFEPVEKRAAPVATSAHDRRGTFSSNTSRKSNATKASIEDDDVVYIARDAPVLDDTSTSIDQSSSAPMFSDQTGVVHTGAPSILTLHLQMSLHPLTLADFISSKSQGVQDNSLTVAKTNRNPYKGLRHCFHTVISILTVLSLLEGVEYLHSEGLVHRDLKPANIFLTPSQRPMHQSIEPCQQCCSPDPLHINVRIGDFGLVTAMADPEIVTDGTLRKAVGTEHYRPSHKANYASGDARLDIFALGIIFFELLWPFETRMERHDVLSALKDGALPSGFAARLGRSGHSISECILAMCNDQRVNMDCSHFKQRLYDILERP